MSENYEEHLWGLVMGVLEETPNTALKKALRPQHVFSIIRAKRIPISMPEIENVLHEIRGHRDQHQKGRSGVPERYRERVARLLERKTIGRANPPTSKGKPVDDTIVKTLRFLANPENPTGEHHRLAAKIQTFFHTGKTTPQELHARLDEISRQAGGRMLLGRIMIARERNQGVGRKKWTNGNETRTPASRRRTRYTEK